MLDGDKLVFERLRLGLGAREHFVHRLGDVDLGRIDAAGDFWNALELALGGELEGADGQSQLLDQRGHDAVFL